MPIGKLILIIAYLHVIIFTHFYMNTYDLRLIQSIQLKKKTHVTLIFLDVHVKGGKYMYPAILY